MGLKNKAYLKEEMNSPLFLFQHGVLCERLETVLSLEGSARIGPDKIITLIQNICGAPNLGENNEVLAPSPIVVRTSFLGSKDKTLVFTDATFNLNYRRSSYGFFMIKYKNPLVAVRTLGQGSPSLKR